MTYFYEFLLGEVYRYGYGKVYLLINTLHLPGGEELLLIGIVLTTVNDRFFLVIFYFPFLNEP